MQNNDEIDLFELFSELWNGKWIIVSVASLGLVFGGAFASLMNRSSPSSYQSSISYSVNSLPPFITKDKAITDLENSISSDLIFEKWKRNNTQTKLNYEAFSPVINVDGVSLYNQPRAYSFSEEKIIIKTGDLRQLDEYYSYFEFVNSEIMAMYIKVAQSEFKFLQDQLLNSSNTSEVAIQRMLDLRLYIDAAKRGSETFLISHPTRPMEVTKKITIELLVALFVVLGGVAGAFYVLLRNAICRRKNIQKNEK